MSRTRQQGYWTLERQEVIMKIIGDKPTKDLCTKAANKINKQKDNYRNFSWYEIWCIATNIINMRRYQWYEYVNENGIKVKVFSPGHAQGTVNSNYIGSSYVL